MPLKDVIAWLNTAATEEDQRLLLHRCLNNKRGRRRSTQKPNAKLYLMKFIFNEVPDHSSKNLVQQGTIRHRIFREIETKRRCYAEYIESGVAPHKCFHYVVTIALSVITDCLICTEYLCSFNLNQSSVYL